jgi:subtilisin family serine protease
MRPLPTVPPINTGYENKPTNPQWNLIQIGADRVWEEFGITGQGVVIGQSDSGVQGDHPELESSYRGRKNGSDYNWFDPWNHTLQPTDIGGHGTHTLGSIVGQNTGVAPGATWYACVNLARNLGNPALYLDCMQFMLAPFPLDGDPFSDGDPTLGAHIINNSWGCPEFEGCDADALLYAVRALRAAGTFVVASAGNDGPACNTLNSPPPIYAETFAVGAIDQFGNLANFSSIGPVTIDGSQRVKPDIVAPGVNVLSSLPGNTYGSYSGTSMAGPHVAGVVALIWSANPSLIGNIERTEKILTQTAQPYSGILPDCPGSNDIPSTAIGYGIVDAYAAVQMALEEGP